MWTLELIPPADGGEMMPPPASTQGTVGTAADGSQRSSGGGSTFSRSKGPWYLAAGEYNVGRKKESNIHINSKSVSRQHALFTVRPLAREEVEAVGSLQTVEVQDLGSSTGTFLNDEANRLEPVTPRVLKAGDVIRVGGARLRLRHQPIVLCPSNLSKAVKETVKEAAAKAGVNLSNKWAGNCTHLVVDKEANATMKVCLAIVQGKPVVDLRWLTEGVLERRADKPFMPMPDPGQYAPGWSKLPNGVASLGTPRTQHFEGVRFLVVAPDDLEELVGLAGAAAVVQVYAWSAQQRADPEGTLAALGDGGWTRTVLLDAEQAGSKTLVERLQRCPGVDGVTSKYRVANSLFSFRPLLDKDDLVIKPRRAPTPVPPSPLPSASKASKVKAAKAGAAPAGDGDALETAAAEGEQEQEQAPAPVASPARATRRSARAGGTQQVEEESAVVTPSSSSSNARATRSRGGAAATAAATPDTSGVGERSTTRKRGRKAAGEEAEEEEEKGREGRAKRVAKGKGEEVKEKQEQQVAVAMEEEAGADASALAAAVASPSRSGTKRKAPSRSGAAAKAEEGEKETPLKRPLRRRSSPESTKAPGLPADGVPPASTAPAPAPTGAKPFNIRRPPPPPPPRPVKPLDPADGWMVAPRKAPAAGRADGEGEGGDAGDGGDGDAASSLSEGDKGSAARRGGARRRGRKRREDEEEQEEEEEDDDDDDNDAAPIEGSTVVEDRDLLNVEFGRGGSIFNYYWQPPGGASPPAAPAVAGAGASGSGLPNFKRFRKNRVLGAVGADSSSVPVQRRRVVVRREDLIAVLPKESEMEVRLRQEEALETERQKEAERLFDEEESVGPKRRKR